MSLVAIPATLLGEVYNIFSTCKIVFQTYLVQVGYRIWVLEFF